MRLPLAAALTLLLAPCAWSADLARDDTLACASGQGRNLFVVVGRLTPYGLDQTIASVTLIDQAPGALMPQADHVPIDLAALEASCPTDAPARLPLGAHFEEGYAEWRQAFDAGEAGVFVLTVDEIDSLLRAQADSPSAPPSSEPQP